MLQIQMSEVPREHRPLPIVAIESETTALSIKMQRRELPGVGMTFSEIDQLANGGATSAEDLAFLGIFVGLTGGLVVAAIVPGPDVWIRVALGGIAGLSFLLSLYFGLRYRRGKRRVDDLVREIKTNPARLDSGP